MADIQRAEVLGVPVDVLSYESALATVEGLITGGSRGNYVLAINPEKVMLLRRDPALLDCFKKAALLLPDGIGVVMAMRFLYGIRASRVTGADFVHRLCALSAQKGYRAYFYGAREEVSHGAVEKLKAMYPGLIVAGRSNGYVKDEDMPALVKSINESGADILFLALGSPKQEQWITRHAPELNVKVLQGIGGTLDTVTGRVKRAPEIFRRTGLEWFYRLMAEPSRLKRQMVLPVFAFKVILSKFSSRGGRR